MPDHVDLDALDRLIAAATPGPWTIKWGDPRMDGTVANFIVEGPHDGKRWPRIVRDAALVPTLGQDAALIVALRNAAPTLLRAARERDELRARAEDVETELMSSAQSFRAEFSRAEKAEARAKAGELLASQVLALIEWIDALADRCDEGLERASIGSLALTAASVKAEEIIAGKEPGEAASEQYAEELVRRTRAELAQKPRLVFLKPSARERMLRDAHAALALKDAELARGDAELREARELLRRSEGNAETECRIEVFLARTAPAQDRTGGEA